MSTIMSLPFPGETFRQVKSELHLQMSISWGAARNRQIWW